MKRLTLMVSGNVQKAGYRDIIIRLGMALGLRGYAENLPDGRVKVVAEGEDRKLELLKESADIKNTLIQVEKIEDSFSEATGEFSGFFKLVKEGETDERLDRAAELLKELIEVNRSGFCSLKDIKRLVYTVSGTPQWEGYSDEVIEIAKNIGLTGYVHNMMDGSVKVVAEGELEKLWLFEERANLRNWHIFSEATGEFSDFYKLEGEADEMMKEIVALLKELVEVWRKGVSDLCNACRG